MMNKTKKIISITHPVMGNICTDSFADDTQFKLFLKAVNGCFVHQNDLTFYDGKMYFINIPFDILKGSVITTKVTEVKLSDMVERHALETSSEA